MTTEAIEKIKEMFADYKTSQSYINRQIQKEITPVFKDIIWETLKNNPLTNEQLTGLIQMFGWKCSDQNFDKYMELCIEDVDVRNELSKRAYEIYQRGLTNIGKTAIKGLTPVQLEQIQSFLLRCFSVKSVDEAKAECIAFEKLNIPQVKHGLYSPWLFYINPTLFPIVNGPHKNFIQWLGLSKKYPDNLIEYAEIRKLLNEPDFACIDSFAFHFREDGTLNYRKYLVLHDKKLFKISHGIFIKDINYKHTGIIKVLEQNNWICMSQFTGKGQGLAFLKSIRVGDYLYICYGGDSLYAFARVLSDAMPLPVSEAKLINDDNQSWYYREVEILFRPVKTDISHLKSHRYSIMPSGNTTLAEISADDLTYINKEIFIPGFNLEISKEEEVEPDKTDEIEDISVENTIIKTTNMILYGPPGTGKTYASMTHAVAIIEGSNFETVEAEEREEIRRRFDKYVVEKQIVFTTFHQSLGYEDFIEGIKPVPPDDGAEKLQYKVNDGIFKKLAINAAFTIAQDLEQPGDGYLKSFGLMYDAYVSSVSERLDKGETVTLDSKKWKIFIIESISDYGNILVKHNEETRTYTVSKNRLSKLDAAFPDLDEVNNIYKDFRGVIGGSNASAYWAVLNAIHEQAPIKIEAQLDAYDYEAKKSVVQNIPVKDFGKANGKPFVLIIDEINRGNIAQIFGELITLIEKDKRMGMPEGLRARLPYSEKEFGVPHNLHIIGTMNTADRSVEALDTALRRRFSFKQLLPDATKLEPTVDGIDLAGMLEVINKRLNILKDSDHTIGHAWFMENHAQKDVEWIKGIFKDKILPLLQEYFYGDYEKIGMVLGESFFEEMERVDSKVFARFKKGTNQAHQFNQKWQYKLKPAEDLQETDFRAIYEGAVNTQTETDEDE